MALELLDIHMQKNKSRHKSYTLHKNQFKMNLRPNKMQGYKCLEDSNIRENQADLGYGNDILDTAPWLRSLKAIIIDKLDFIKF